MIGSDILTRLYDEHAPALVLYARQWADASEDVVQEALLKLTCQKRLPDDPVAWLFRVVRNGAISQAREQSRRRKRETVKAASSIGPVNKGGITRMMEQQKREKVATASNPKKQQGKKKASSKASKKRKKSR